MKIVYERKKKNEHRDQLLCAQIVSNFAFAMRKINDFEMRRKIAAEPPCCIIQRRCPGLIYSGNVLWAVPILPAEHLQLCAGGLVLCSETPGWGMEQDEECLLLPSRPCARLDVGERVSLKKSLLEILVSIIQIAWASS